MSSRCRTQEQIDAIVGQSESRSIRLGEKTTVMLTTLPNGFEIVTSSSCVEPGDYDHDLGIKLCKRRLEDKLWELEGYALQWFGDQDA